MMAIKGAMLNGLMKKMIFRVRLTRKANTTSLKDTIYTKLTR